jgi:DNA invertase Pin-like site-specific DNA recombinase
LNACLADAVKSKKKGGKGHIIIADFSRLSRKAWHAMQFFEKVLAKDKCKLIICDKPAYSNLDTDALVSVLGQESMIAQSVAERASSATKQGLARINAEINSKGFHTAKNGKIVYKLGVHENMDLARENAGIRVSDDADAFANMWYQDIQYRLNAGHSYRTIAEEFNARGFSTAREGGSWHASTISNIIKRVEKK